MRNFGIIWINTGTWRIVIYDLVMQIFCCPYSNEEECAVAAAAAVESSSGVVLVFAQQFMPQYFSVCLSLWRRVDDAIAFSFGFSFAFSVTFWVATRERWRRRFRHIFFIFFL